MAKLVVCTGCSRHVRSAEASCPFCGATVHESSVRVGTLAAASVMVAVLAGCGGSQTPPPTDATEVKVVPPDDKAATEEPEPAPEEPVPEEPAPTEPEEKPDPGPVMMYASPPR